MKIIVYKEEVNMKVIFFGAGSYAKFLWEQINKNKQLYIDKYRAFADNNENLWGRYFCEKRVISPNRIKEYEILRNEIDQKIELHNSLLTFTITTVVAILSFILLQNHPYSAFLFLIPFCILIPMSMRIAYYRSAMARLSAYMIVFLEEEIPGIQWETLNQKIVSEVIGEKGDTSEKKKKKYPFVGITKIQRLLFGEYYECLVIGILCYILFAIHYYQESHTCFWRLFNLSWPLLLVVLEAFITIAMDSVDKSKVFWVEQWKKLKNSEKKLSADNGSDN